MTGVLTELDLVEADQEFPGIQRYFEALPCKPRTFLELVARYEHWCTTAKIGVIHDGAPTTTQPK